MKTATTRPWFRWALRIGALIVIAFGALILLASAPVNTAGNTGIWFISELEGFRGGIDDAYDRLCVGERSRFEREAFAASGGDVYAVLANAGAIGGAAQYEDDAETLSGSVTSAWKEYEVTTSTGAQTWRVNLVRERDWWEFKGEWKVCGLDQV